MTWRQLLDPPLVPSPEQGRDLLRRELLDPTYHQDNLMQRLLARLDRWINDVLQAASTAPPLSIFVAMTIGLVLVLALIWLATRARSAPQRHTQADAFFPDATISASEWRARADSALVDGRHGDALVDAFRALVARQVERGRLDAPPGTTAREVTQALLSPYPHQAARMLEAARLFDLVLYGDREPSREQAASVLALDDELLGVR